MTCSSRTRAFAAFLTLGAAASFVGCDKPVDPATGEKEPIKQVIKEDLKAAGDKTKELAGKAKEGIKEAGHVAGEKIKEAEVGVGKAMKKAGESLEKAGTKAPEIKVEVKPEPPK
jgi:hypothetical protein